jgi:hypothetical protein
MKQKIKVDIHKDGYLNEPILKMVGRANERGRGLYINDICGYINAARLAGNKHWEDNWKWEIVENDGIVISEDNKQTATLSLHWIEITELEEVKTGGEVPAGWDKQ